MIGSSMGLIYLELKKIISADHFRSGQMQTSISILKHFSFKLQNYMPLVIREMAACFADLAFHQRKRSVELIDLKDYVSPIQKNTIGC